MIIVRLNQEHFFAASKKAIPGLVQQLVKGEGLEALVNSCEYFEFNTREKRTGKLGPYSPLSDLVVISCGLAKQDDEEEEIDV